jgi:phenylalanyl-tRNA synthetase beta chain
LQLFETGRVFGPAERRTLALYSQGNLYPSNLANDPSPKSDFFSLKGVVESIGGGLEFKQSSDPRLHPTRQAAVGDLGVMGLIHPDAAAAAGLPDDAVLAELDLEAIAELSSGVVHFKPISRNPSVRRDIAVVVDKAVAFGALEKAAADAAGDVLEKLWLFDIYEGKGIPEGKHSLAIALQLRKMGANFTDEEANQVRGQVVAALEALGAIWRG